MKKEAKKGLIESNRIHEKDCGSSDVQIAVLSGKIAHLAGHLKDHPKDNHSRYGLLIMVGKRRKHQAYLKKTDPQRYTKLAANLGIK